MVYSTARNREWGAGRREQGEGGGLSRGREEEGGKSGEVAVRRGEGEGRRKESRGGREEGEMERGTRQKRKRMARAEGQGRKKENGGKGR